MDSAQSLCPLTQDVDVPRLWSELLAAGLQQPASAHGEADAMKIEVEPGMHPQQASIQLMSVH